jgi:hypothetical protein
MRRLLVVCISLLTALAGCGGGGAGSENSGQHTISELAAEAAVKRALEQATQFQEGSHSRAGRGDYVLLRCGGIQCQAEIHQGKGSSFVYVIASYEVRGSGSHVTPVLTGYRCPVENSYCVTLEENAGPSSG